MTKTWIGFVIELINGYGKELAWYNNNSKSDEKNI